MTFKKLGDVLEFVRKWALGHSSVIAEVYIAGGQARLNAEDPPKLGADIDLVVIVSEDDVQEYLIADLARSGLQYSILFHPLVMTQNDFEEKLRIRQYRTLMESSRKLYP